MKKHLKLMIALALALLLHGVDGKAATWQETLQSKFDIVDTFDEIQDWTPGGQWYSSAGCATCASNSTLPKNINGTKSIWGLWNNKGLSFEYTPASGTFVIGDVITGGTSGTTATVRRVWNLDGKWYIQLTNTNAVQGTSKFVAGERVSSGSKTGTNLQWPLFIADQGAANTWKGTGKSLVMDIGDNDNTKALDPTMAGLGAQRMATFFGDGATGKSGYKKVYAFFMIKVSPTFFKQTSGSYDAVSVVKLFDFDSGFTTVSKWGTSSEAAQVSSTDNIINEYGLNFSIFNFGGGGLSYPHNLFLAENTYVPTGTSPNYTYSQTVSNRPLRSGTNLDANPYIASGDWFGIEVASDIGTLGNKDGSTDFWIYDKNGVEKGHFSVTGENRLLHFDHLYNKFVLGGNRRSVSGATGGLDSRWWIDDVIINGSRIGTTYFQLLAGQGTVDTTAPVATITSPVGGANVTGTTTISVSASDNVAVSKVEFYVNGALKGTDTASPYAYAWSTSTVADGSYTLTAKAYDASGNVGQSTSVPVTVKNTVADTTAPTASITAPASGSTVAGTVSVSVNAGDNLGVSKVELYLNGAIYGVAGTSPYSISWNTASYLNGAYTLMAKAYDAAGNVGTSSATTVTVNNLAVVTKYSITASAGAGGTISPAGTVSVTSGSSQSYTITPSTGYKIAAVTVDGVSKGALSTYSFSNVTANHTIAASFTASTIGKVVFAANAGAAQYLSPTGVTYLADTKYSGGAGASTTATITGTTEGKLYQSERYGSSFSYSIPLTKGKYSVTLKFAELANYAAGGRVFSVAFGGTTVISNLDLAAKVGKNAAYDVTIPVSVTNGVLTIKFTGQKGNAKVNAIVVKTS